MYMHIKAIEALRAVNGTLPVNIKFLVEGEEEVGGVSVAKYVAENPEKLKADVALVSDTSMYAAGMPTLDIGLRGLIYMEIESRGPSRDLHSGVYGGAAPNAVFGLIELLAKVKNANGQIKMPGILRRRRAARAGEKRKLGEAAVQREGIPEGGSRVDQAHRRAGLFGARADLGAADVRSPWHRGRIHRRGQQDRDSGESRRPRCSFRLVPNQDPDKIIESFRAFIKKNTPKGIQLEVRVLGAGPGLMVNPDHPAIRIASKAFSDIFNAPTVFTRSGGSIPIVGDFATHLGIPTILMGFGLPDDGLHSPNEKYNIENYYKGIMTIAHFFEEYGRA